MTEDDKNQLLKYQFMIYKLLVRMAAIQEIHFEYKEEDLFYAQAHQKMEIYMQDIEDRYLEEWQEHLQSP